MSVSFGSEEVAHKPIERKRNRLSRYRPKDQELAILFGLVVSEVQGDITSPGGLERNGTSMLLNGHVFSYQKY